MACDPAETGLQVQLRLQAEGGWRIGGGEQSLNAHDKQPDLLPQHERRIVWTGQQGHLADAVYLLPGSALKGALRHRTAYHYRCLNNEFTSPGAPTTDCSPAVDALFGTAADPHGDAKAGLLFFHDLAIPPAATAVLMHNRIDRYTGGVINHALFSEEVLWQTPLQLRIDVHPAALNLDNLIRQAFQQALQDLAHGWLPLGANGSRGLGTFLDPDGIGPQWSDAGRWLHGISETEAHT